MKKILIANRGEIAVRVIRTARSMGIATVAVYSDADKGAIHVREADEAIYIGPSPAVDSYLREDKIIEAALSSKADAIHPGYGFLSEKSSFSRACRDAGIIFIGPPPEAMDQLGGKISAKKLAVQCKVPITPGYFEPGATPDTLKKEAEAIGYPVMLKASAGGGGRGMRVVSHPDDFLDACRLAMDESLKAFGDSAMMVEKVIEQPRHIEVQIIADSHGQVACLFERECSLQRRHQKVIEETPSPIMTQELWDRMKSACTSLILESGYQGAGTVEFMYDPKSGEFYFLEVNARLQVEHPVTEAITGLDLVKWQINVARGEKLELPELLMQGDRRAIHGHSIECRLIAENPAAGFLPSVGTILGWSMASSPTVRVDTGFETGSIISPYYDSLIAKIITHGENRSEAIRSMSQALLDTHVLGIETNAAFLKNLVESDNFGKGEMDTGLLDREWKDWKPSQDIPAELLDIADFGKQAKSNGIAHQVAPSAWAISDAFRNVRT